MRYLILVFSISFFFLFISCGKDNEEPKQSLEQVPAGVHAVKAIESIDASSYTYIKVEENANEYWIAVPQMGVKKGEALYFAKSMEMKNFKSETLGRTFESILFVDDIKKELKNPQTQPQHPVPTSTKEEKINIQKLKDGKSIGEIFSQMDKLNGKTIKVKGKVVKFNPGIMGTNWIHIQDGTEYQNEYDFLVTCNTPVEVGQVIVAEGKLIINKDFGSGYSYKALIENAKIKMEL